MSSLQTKPRKTSRWTPARRAAQAEAIRRWKPWVKSTGPRTAAGKARAAQNAAKPHSLRKAELQIVKAMKNQAIFLRKLTKLSTLIKKIAPNELLNRLHASLLREGNEISRQLVDALLYAKLCKNLAMAPPNPINVNANDNE